MGIRTLAELRERAPERLKRASDAELVTEFANQTGRDPQQVAEYFGMKTGRGRGDFVAGLSSGVDQLQGLGYSALGGAADILGANTVQEWAMGRAKQQEYEAYLAGKPELDRVEDIGSVGGAIDWAQYQLGKQLPIMGGLIGAQFVPGIGKAAAVTRLSQLGAVAPRALGGGGLGSAVGAAARAQAIRQGRAVGPAVLAGSTLGFGDLYQASGEDGEYNPYAALAMSLPYGAAEAVVPSLVSRGLRVDSGFTGGLASRVAKAVGTAALTEGTTEAFQTTLTRAIDSTATAETAGSEYLNAILTGAVVGGTLGGTAGIRGRRGAEQPPELNELGERDLTAGPVTPTDDPMAGMDAPTDLGAVQETPSVNTAETPVGTMRDVVFSDPNNTAVIQLQEQANVRPIATGQLAILSQNRARLQEELESIPDPELATKADGTPYSQAYRTRLINQAERQRADIEAKIAAIDAKLEGHESVVQSRAKLNALEEALDKIDMSDGQPLVRVPLEPEEQSLLQEVEPDLFTSIYGEDATLTASNEIPETRGPTQTEVDLTKAVAPAVVATGTPDVVADTVAQVAPIEAPVEAVTEALITQELESAVSDPILEANQSERIVDWLTDAQSALADGNPTQAQTLFERAKNYYAKVVGEPVETDAEIAAQENKQAEFDLEQEQLGVELFSKEEMAALEKEIENINKGKGALNAELQSVPNKFGGKVALPNGVIAGIAVMLRNPRAVVAPKAFQKGVVAVDQKLTDQYAEIMLRAKELFMELAKQNFKLMNLEKNITPKTTSIANYQAKAGEVQNTLNELYTLLGEGNVDAGRATMQAIISSIKTRNEAKWNQTPNNYATSVLAEGTEFFGKRESFGKLLEYNTMLDTMISTAFANDVNGFLTPEGIALRINPSATRTSKQALKRGNVQPLEDATKPVATGDLFQVINGTRQLVASGVPRPDVLEKGQKWKRSKRNKGGKEGGILGILTEVANPAEGTSGPYAIQLAKAIRNALRNATTESGANPLPAVVFYEPGTDTPRYDPSVGQFGTIFISRTESQEVVLHESLHAALQWYVTQNPDDIRVTDLSAALDELFAFMDTNGIANLDMSEAYKKQARAVVNLLRGIRDAGREQDAVLELISYGSTMSAFNQLLRGIKTSSPNTEAVNNWFARIEGVFNGILNLISRFLGVTDTLANRVLSNTVMLLERTGEDYAPESFSGNSLDQSIDSATYRNSSEAAVDAAGRYNGQRMIAASDNKTNDWTITSRPLFNVVNWEKWFGKELADGTIEPGLFQEKMSQLADTIRENSPGLTRFISLFNAFFTISSKVVRASLTRFKQERSAGFLFADKVISYLETQTPETVQAFIRYMDTGKSFRLDKMAQGENLKYWGGKLKSLMIDYAKTLSEGDRDYFIKYDPKTKEYVLAQNFSQIMFRVSSDKAVSSHKLGVANIPRQIKAATEAYSEETFTAHQSTLMETDPVTGEPLLDGEFYMIEVDRSGLTGAGDTAVFVSKELYDSLDGDIDGRVNFGPGTFLRSVNTGNVYRYVEFKDKTHRFALSKSFADSMNEKKAKEFILAMRNTYGGLSNHFASANLFKNLAATEGTDDAVVFGSLRELNEALGITDIDSMYTEKNLSAAEIITKDPNKLTKSNWVARSKGVFIRVPGNIDGSGAWGELGGKIIPGELWTAMNDVSDRSPSGPKAYNDTLQVWKKSKTIYNLGTHITNALSNVALMMFHGIPLMNAVDAARLLYRYETAPLSMSRADLMLMDSFVKSGAMLGNFANTEIKMTVADAMTAAIKPLKEDTLWGKAAAMLDVERSMSKAAFDGAKKLGLKGKEKAKFIDSFLTKAYNMEDNVFRLAAFMTRAGDLMKKDGLTMPTEDILYTAGLFAKNAFIDYDVDAKGIKMARQSIIPFVSYTYGIVPVLARIVATKPWLIANTFALMTLMDYAAAALAGDDDDELRKLGPDNMDERMFGFGPRAHIRLPFFGDSENPVYLRWGDYVPLSSNLHGGAPNNFMGIDAWPQGLTPSNPLLSVGMAMFGYDAYTGKSIYSRGNMGLDSSVEAAKQIYTSMAPPMFSAKNFERVKNLIDQKTGPTGVEPSAAMFMFGRVMGLRVEQYNIGEQDYFRQMRASENTREFRAAINKARRDEFRKGYPDYEALDKRIMELYDGMWEEYNRIYRIED